MMLIFTNRQLGSGTTESAFGRNFTPGGTQLAVASVAAAGKHWELSDRDEDVSEEDALNLLLPLFKGNKPVLLYVHGNNNTPADCFGRVTALRELYPSAELMGFSWPSEGFLSDGSPLPSVPMPDKTDEAELAKVKAENRTKGTTQDKIRRYHQAQTNAKDSVDAFARMLRLLGTARLHANTQPFSLALHSLGAHLFQYTLQVSGATESASTAHNVALLAPCVRAASHPDWLTRFRPKGRTYVAYNKGDNVLFGASIADGEQAKLGADPGPDIVRSEAVRYVNFSNAANGFGGHGYFVNGVTKKARKLFSRIFASQADLGADESPKTVYPMGCDPDKSTCYMAVPDQPDVLP
jgi:esterase/lipase superfamily enzyme